SSSGRYEFRVKEGYLAASAGAPAQPSPRATALADQSDGVSSPCLLHVAAQRVTNHVEAHRAQLTELACHDESSHRRFDLELYDPLERARPDDRVIADASQVGPRLRGDL